MRHARFMAHRAAASIPVDLRPCLETARLVLRALFRALDRMDLSPAEIPQRLLRQLFALDADYVEALWALDQPMATLDLHAMLRHTLAALQQLPEVCPFPNQASAAGSSRPNPTGKHGSPQIRPDAGIQHGSRPRPPKTVRHPMSGGKKANVEGAFEVAGDQVGFRLGSYDHSKALVIDPVLSYLTYLAGTGTDEI